VKGGEGLPSAAQLGGADTNKERKKLELNAKAGRSGERGKHEVLRRTDQKTKKAGSEAMSTTRAIKSLAGEEPEESPRGERGEGVICLEVSG